MSNYYPFDFLIYSVGKHPKYFLKLVAKYDGVLNPTIVLTSATVYRPSFSSLAASLKRILRIKSMVDSPVIAFSFRCRLERLMFISLGEFVGREFDVIHILFHNRHGTFQQGFIHCIECDFLRFYFQ